MSDPSNDVAAAEPAERWHSHILGPVFYPSALIIAGLRPAG